jgi:hypothetical protein
MDKSELILLIGQIATDAGAAGAADIAKFWTSVSAKITSDMLGARKSAAAERRAEPSHVFMLSAQAYSEQLTAQMAAVPAEQRAKKFELIRVAVNASQQHGGITLEQADMLRRVTSQVEQSLAGKP